MRYTRYDYKKKKNNGFLLWLVIIVLLAIVIGVGVFKLFLQNNNGQISLPQNKPVVNSTTNDVESKEFYIIQCGLYSQKETADKMISSIPKNYPAFVVEEDGKFKVMAGIYNEDAITDKMKGLTDSSIGNFRVKCELKGENTDDKIEREILKSYIDIIYKLYDKGANYIDTKEFKSWVNTSVEKSTGSSEELKDLATNISQIPDEYKKEDGQNSTNYLYKLLIKYKA